MGWGYISEYSVHSKTAATVVTVCVLCAVLAHGSLLHVLLDVHRAVFTTARVLYQRIHNAVRASCG